MASTKRRNWILIILVLLILALIAAVYMKGKSRPKGEEVTVEKSILRTIKETVSASGRIFPEYEVKISSDVSGEIVQLLVQEGDSVVVGQILAKIDPEAFVSSVERGQAGLNNAKAQLAMAKSQIQNSTAQKEQITAQLINAKKIHERNIKLKNDGVISDVEFEQSLSNLQALEANIRAASASIASAQENANAAEFMVNSSAASLKELNTSLNRTTIKSPANGVVSSLSVEEGERVVGTIQMTGTEMMRIANLNSMEVQVEVSENDILKVSLNDDVDIEVDAYIDQKFSGKVSEIANSAANAISASGGSNTSLNTDQVTNFIVKIRIDPESYKGLIRANQQYPFRPGMSASVDIYTEKKEGVISVPIQAVTIRDMRDKEAKKAGKEEDMQEVVFVMENDSAKLHQVVTGIQDDEYIHVESGISVDQDIVTGPYATVSKKLEDGMRLRIKEEKEEKEEKK